MANRDDKPNREKKDLGDSSELFEDLFATQLIELRKGKNGKEKPKARPIKKKPVKKEAQRPVKNQGFVVEKRKPEEKTPPVQKEKPRVQVGAEKTIPQPPKRPVSPKKVTPTKTSAPVGGALPRQPVRETVKGGQIRKPVKEGLPETSKPVLEAAPKKKNKFERKKNATQEVLGKGIGILRILLLLVFVGLLVVFLLNYQWLLGIQKEKAPPKVAAKKETRFPIKKIVPRKAVAKKPKTPPPPQPNRERQQAKKTIAKEKAPPIQKPAAASVSIQYKESMDLARLNVREMVSSHPYSIYLGSYKDHTRLKDALSDYREMGLDPYWVKVDLGDKGIWLRVFCGCFQKKDQADAFIKEKQLKGAVSKHMNYANLIGIYQSQYELEKMKLILLEHGYSPYVIQGIKGASALFTGAFYTKEGAEMQLADLTAKGIKGRVVQR